MKLTRRELATTAVLTALAPAAPAQEPDPLKAAADALGKFEIPMATEPAFVFKP